MSSLPGPKNRDESAAAQGHDPATYNEVVEALSKACDVAVWMSGSPSFSPEGEAHKGWVEYARPSLSAALAVLKRTWGDVPDEERMRVLMVIAEALDSLGANDD